MSVRATARCRGGLGWSMIVLLLVACVPLVGAGVTGSGGYLFYLASQIALWGIFAMAFDVLLGFAGIVSFGHALFFGLGGYAAAIVFRALGDPFSALLGGAIVGAVLGLLVGLLALRSFGVAIILLTFALAEATWLIVLSDPRGLTGGEGGLPGVQPPSYWGAGADLTFYCIVAALFLGTFAALSLLTRSSFGRVLSAIRENEQRVVCMGFDTRGYKLAAFAISAALSGVAGAANAFTQRQASPDSLHWMISADVLLFVLLGGRGTLLGPVVAAAAIIVLRAVLSEYLSFWPLVIGAIYVVAAVFLPAGLFGAPRRGSR